VIGALFILAMLAYMPGSELVASSLDSANRFNNINTSQLYIGIMLEFINSAVVVGIASLLFPILKKINEWVAVAYAASRIIESILLIICSVCALLLPLIGPEAVDTAGYTILKFRELLFQMAMISLGAGSIAFCCTLYNGKLAPGSLSILGIIGYIALFISGWLNIFGFGKISTILFIPGAIFEIGFPIWLFIKGFADHPQSSLRQLS